VCSSSCTRNKALTCPCASLGAFFNTVSLVLWDGRAHGGENSLEVVVMRKVFFAVRTLVVSGFGAIWCQLVLREREQGRGN